MANVIKTVEQKKQFREVLSRLFQSGNLNFILGSGASYPAISVSGNVEKEIQQALDANNELLANDKIYDLLKGVENPFATLILPPIEEATKSQDRKTTETNTVKSIAQYTDLLKKIEAILSERKTSLIPKLANIFTTNYDLFLEKTSENFPAIVFNDGFARTPNIGGWHEFSSRSFLNTTYSNGNLYNYRVELPTINFIKVHGSLSWLKYNEKIFWTNLIRQDATPINKKTFNDQFSLILPRRDKLKETIMDRTYYDLLRIFANELDKENTVLVAFGFSFLDEHIRDITLRALKNPTLRLVVFAFDAIAEASLNDIFKGYSNVDIYTSNDNSVVDFEVFNKTLDEVLNPPDEQEVEDEEL